MTTSIVCEVCAATFMVRDYRASTARFCSRRCCSSWHARTRLNGRPRPRMLGNKLRAGLPPTNSFQHGQAPWNKGVKGLHLSPASEFQTGQAAWNALPIGAVTIRLDRQGNPRAWVKVDAPSLWQLRAVVVWTSANGPVPDDQVIHHKNRDTLDDRIENLEAKSRADHMREHDRELRRAKSNLRTSGVGS